MLKIKYLKNQSSLTIIKIVNTIEYNNNKKWMCFCSASFAVYYLSISLLSFDIIIEKIFQIYSIYWVFIQ